jgi:hypothetical protein
VTTRARFTDAEWAQLVGAPIVVGASMMAASKSGLIGKVGEFFRLYRSLKTRRVPPEFEQHELVTALRRQLRALSVSPLSASTRTEFSRARGDAAAARQLMLAECKQVAVLLAAKTPPDEADGVKRWLMWIARNVAGTTGHVWSGAEKTPNDLRIGALEQLAHALRTPAMPIVPAPERPLRANPDI